MLPRHEANREIPTTPQPPRPRGEQSDGSSPWVRRASTSSTSSRTSRDAYPGALEETILTEIVANALDSGASRIRLVTDPVGAVVHRRRRRLGHATARAGALSRRGGEHEGARRRHRLRRCRHQARAPRVRRGRHREPRVARRTSRRAGIWPRAIGRRGAGCRRRGSSPSAARPCASGSVTPCRRCSTAGSSRRRSGATSEPLLDRAFDAVLRVHYPRGVRLEVNGRELEPVLRGRLRARTARAPDRPPAQAVGRRLAHPRAGAPAPRSGAASPSAPSAR